MEDLFEKFMQSGVDVSYIGLERVTDPDSFSGYCCEPVGMRPFGALGTDGVHFGFIDGFGEMVFSVDPSAIAGNEVHPIANNFEEFLRVVFAVKNASTAEQIYWMTKEQFEELVKDGGSSQYKDDPEMMKISLEINAKAEKALAAVQAELKLEPMPDPYEYVRGVQAAFDHSRIKFTDEYYEMSGLDKPE